MIYRFLLWLGFGPFFAWAHEALCALTTEDGRKGWAMLAGLGACVAMTGYAVASLYLVRGNEWFAFLLGVAALVINLIVVTGLMVLLGIRRKVEVEGTKDGVRTKIEDTGQ